MNFIVMNLGFSRSDVFKFFCRCVFVFVDMMEGRAGVFGGGHPVIGWHLPRKRSSSLIKSQS